MLVFNISYIFFIFYGIKRIKAIKHFLNHTLSYNLVLKKLFFKYSYTDCNTVGRVYYVAHPKCLYNQARNQTYFYKGGQHFLAPFCSCIYQMCVRYPYLEFLVFNLLIHVLLSYLKLLNDEYL
jgi:hypothetical protein